MPRLRVFCRPVRAFSIGLFALVASCGERTDETTIGDLSDLTESVWIGHDTDRLAALTERPGECLRPTDDADQYSIEVGRAAFRSPFLFGGPAARSGLSCNACHSDGRVNRAFFIEGLSGLPGTADVTSAIFSKERGDDIFNPVAIPDLVDAAERNVFGTIAGAPTIHEFVSGAVTAEFQGVPPPDRVLGGLADYVANLRSDACPGEAVKRTPGDELAASKRALLAALEALSRSESATADFLLISARHELGRIDERFFDTAHKEIKQRLLILSREIATARGFVVEKPADARRTLLNVVDKMDALAPSLRDSVEGSFYDTAVVSRALAEDGF